MHVRPLACSCNMIALGGTHWIGDFIDSAVTHGRLSSLTLAPSPVTRPGFLLARPFRFVSLTCLLVGDLIF